MSRSQTKDQKPVTTEKAAELLGVHGGTIRKWAKNGKLKARKDDKNGGWQFAETDLNQFKTVNATSTKQKPNQVKSHNEKVSDEINQQSLDMLMQVPAGIAVVHGKEHVYTFANPLYKKIFNREGVNVIGKTLRQVFPEIKGQGVYDLFDNVFVTGQPYEADEYPVTFDRAGNGKLEQGFFSFVAKPIKDSTGKVTDIMIHASEVTNQIQARKQAENSEARFRTLMEQSPLSVQVFDSTGKSTAVNSAWEKLWQSPKKEVEGYNILNDKQLKANGMMPYIEKAFKGQSVKLPVIYYDPTLIGKNGRSRWIEGYIYPLSHRNGQIFEVALVHSDITERKEAEEALRESESQFRTLTNSMPQIAFIANKDGKTVYLNKRWYDYVGDTSTTRGLAWLSFIHPEDVPKVKKGWNESLKAGEPFRVECRLRRYDGKYRWHLGRTEPIKNRKGEIEQWLGTSTDIHDLRQAIRREQQLERKTSLLKEQREHLLELNKAKDDFISLASHQLRTPATAVKQYLGLTLQGFFGNLTAKQKEMINVAYRNNERQLTVVEDLLKVARLDSGNVKLAKRQVDVKKLLAEAIDDQHAITAERNQAVAFNCGSGSVLATIDRSRIGMVVENLLDNASKYSKPDTKINVSLRQNNRNINISVADQGIGIAKKNQDKLFTKFARFDNSLSDSVSGTGLGLYWVSKIVDLHQGSITFESKVGKGTTFTVTLPKN